jgi:aldehyde:ferredoxin oxidoreductase
MTLIRGELQSPRVQIACIGPAGEKLVRLANVMVGDGSSSRTGMGALMGSKNLKAIAVKGTKGVRVAESDLFMALAKDLEQRQFKCPNYPGLSMYGTTRLLNYWQRNNTIGMRNCQITGKWAGYDELSHETLQRKYFAKDYACFCCPLSCHSRWRIEDGPYAGEKGPFVEVGPIAAWGPTLDICYAPSVLKAVNLCNQYGLDALNCGELVAALTEWYQRGLITRADTGGIELSWGDHEAMLKIIPKIANREDIGNLLAEGGVRAAKKIGRGADKCITHCKGAMTTNGDHRVSKSWQLGLAVATRGSDHLRGATQGGIRDYTGKEAMELQLYSEGQAKSVYDVQCVCTMADALEICKFSTTRVGMATSLTDMAKLFSAATGVHVDEDGIREIADRIWTLERAFLVRQGVTREDDTHVGRWRNEPPNGGPIDGVPHDQKKWDKLLDEYYDLVGWDKETGAPTRRKLEALGLKDVADELERDAVPIKERRSKLPWVGEI